MNPSTSTPVGVSNLNPETPVGIADSQEESSDAAANNASAGGTVMYAGTPITLTLVQRILAAAQSFGTTFQTQEESLSENCILIDPAHRLNVGTVGSRRLTALPMILQLMQDHPSLPSAQSSDQINASMTAASAMLKLSASLTLLASHCSDTARVLNASAWSGVSPAYAAACVQAKHDQTMASPVASIQAVLSVGSKKDTAVQTAAKAQQLAVAAEARATAARARATAAQAKANALTGDATITPPGSTAPASTPATPTVTLR